jgi:PKD domain/IPT/TIG domain
MGMAIAAIIALSIWAPSAAHASGCTDTFTNTAGGSWSTAANWSKKAPPTSEEEACITDSGTYTVTLSAASVNVESLTIGGSSGTQTLAVESSCAGSVSLGSTDGLIVGARGALALTDGSLCANSVTLGGPVTNAGTITSAPGTGGGARNLEGSLTNTGKMTIAANTSFNGSKATLTNEGALELAEGLELYVGSGNTFSNGAGGSIVATGTANVFVPSGATFDEGAGTTSGSQPVIAQEATVDYTGSGSSTIKMRIYPSHLSGNISSGQSLEIEGCVGNGYQAVVGAASGFTNEGSITLTSAKNGGNDCGSNDNATLNVESGTLVNKGTITTEAGNGGERYLNGNVTNQGKLALDSSASVGGTNPAWENEGALDLAEGTRLYFAGSGTFTNGAGGSVAATGAANVFVPDGSTFVEGDGTTSGSQPVIAEDSTVSYTGSGSSTIKMRNYPSHLSGNISSGQSLEIEGCVGNGYQVVVGAASGFTNEGSIALTSAKNGGNDCGSNDNATLNVESGTLVNKGTITTEAGNGGERYLNGNVTNQGKLALDSSASVGGTTPAWENEGALDLAEGTRLYFAGSGTFTNGSGGSIATAGSADVYVPAGSTFDEGAGVTSGSQPVIADEATVDYTGSGSSTIKMRSYPSRLRGNISSGQSLEIEGCVGNGYQVVVGAASGFTNEGSIALTSAKNSGNDCGSNDNATLNVESGTLTNKGTIATEAGNGGERYLNGSVTNRGKLAVDASVSVGGTNPAWENEGTLDLAEGTQLDFGGSGTFTNGSGGSIATAGSADVYVPAGSTFDEGAGVTSGSQPVIADEATVDYTGSGSSTIKMRSYPSRLSGNISSGQSLEIEGCAGNGYQAVVGAASGFTNEGSIALTSAKNSGNNCGSNDNATLNVENGGTLTNIGTIATEAGNGGERYLNGNLANDRLLSLGAGTTLKLTGSYTEAKAGTLETMIGGTSDFGALSATGSATLAGTVLARQVNSFKGQLGQKFAILGAASRSGAFAHTSGATIGPDLYYAPVDTATGTNLDVLEGEPPEKVPTNVTRPTISGGTQQGQTIVLDASGSWAQEPGEFSYQWLRCESSGANCQAIEGAIGRSYLLTGADAGHRITVQVIAYNNAGESEPAEPSAPSPVITALPLHAAAGEAISAVEGEAVTLDGSGSTPASEIAKYRWQFGDGAEAEGAGDAVLHHVYATAGKYTARLTVFRNGEEASASVAVTVTAKPKPAGGGHPAEGVYVTVKNTSAAPLAGATVLYVGSGGARIEATSNSSGEAVLTGMPEGTDTVYVYKTGLRPAVATVTVNGEGDGSASITLSSGELATAEVKSKELNYEEIVAAGINPSEPANQNVYKFVVKLAFIESPAPPVEIHGYVNSGGEFVGGTGAGGGGGGWSCGSGGCEGGGGGGGGGGERIIAQPEVVEGHPLIQWLILHGKAAVLKQFFEVSMIVQNLSPEPFELAKGTATLNLPEGLSLAPTTKQQALTNEVPAVPGGASATTNWIIRGDTPGEYNLSANYNSTLEPFDAPVSVQAALANPLKVWGKEAMTLKVKADEGKLHEGVPYHVYVGVENKSDVPLYNVNLTIEEEPHEHFIFQPEQQFSEQVGELKPGETFFVKRPYILVPDNESESVFNPALSSATFDGEKEHPGANIEKIKAPTLYSLESAPSIHGYVRLKWAPVPGAEGYEVFSTKNLDTLFTNMPLSVLQSSSAKTGVTELPASATEAYVPASSTEPLWYALSTVLGGHLELESSPMVKASAPVSTVPTVASVSPALGTVAGGTPIRITGTNFVAGASVEIGQGSGAGSTAVPASEVVVVSPTEITAVTGGPAKGGTWNVFVIDSGGTSLSNTTDSFTYSTKPTVSSVSPSSGTVNGRTPIRITGTNFLPGSTVEIAQGGGAGPTAINASEVVVVSPTEITAVTGGPAKAGTWNVFVTDAAGTSLSNTTDRYTYSVKPTVSSVTPSSGTVKGEAPIRVVGTNFVAGATVKIAQGNGPGSEAIPASEVVVVSSTEITAVTGGPAKAGTWNLYVTDSGGTSAASTADRYTYK